MHIFFSKISQKINQYKFNLEDVSIFLNLLRLRNRNKNKNKNKNKKYIILDGFISIKKVSILYFFICYFLNNNYAKNQNNFYVPLIIIEKWYHRFTFANLILSLLESSRFVSLSSSLNKDSKISEEIFIKSYSRNHNFLNKENILNLKIDKFPFGEHIYCSFLRNLKIGSTNSINNKFFLKSIHYWFRAKEIINNFRPEYVFLTHSSYTTYGSIFANSLLNNLYTTLIIPYSNNLFSGRSYKGMKDYSGDKRFFLSLSNKTIKKIKQFPANKIDQSKINKFFKIRINGSDELFEGFHHKTTKKYNRESLKYKLGIHADINNIVLVGAHQSWDDPLHYDMFFDDYVDWFESTVKTLIKNKNTHVIVKAHPSERTIGTNDPIYETYKKIIGKFKHTSFIQPNDSINTYSLIELSDFIVTVRGTIGIEALCFNKQVITGGFGPYSNIGLTIDSNSRKDYLQKIINLDTLPKVNINTFYAKQILFYYLTKGIKSDLLNIKKKIASGRIDSSFNYLINHLIKKEDDDICSLNKEL